jgi:tryptophan synthase beta chain
MFYPFILLNEGETAGKAVDKVRLVGTEAGGTGEPGCYSSASLNFGAPGVLHGQNTMLLQDKDGQIQPSHSVSAGLDYPGVGPEHAYFHRTGQVEYTVVVDGRALAAFAELCRSEGIIPALESAHALAWVLDNAPSLPAGGQVVVNLSGRGDKDMEIIRKNLPELCGAKAICIEENK